MTSRYQCIQRQVNELKENPDLRNIQLQDNAEYVQLTYSPPETNTYFRNTFYRLRIDLPIDYPEQPPTVYFQDIIYHLNVHQTTGEVYMSIIKEDWSPYLTLNSVIQTISSILIQADVQFPASKAMLKQYNEQYGIYLEKVHNSVRTVQKLNEQLTEQIVQVGLAKIGMLFPSTIFQNNSTQNKNPISLKNRRNSENLKDTLEVPSIENEIERTEICKLDVYARQDSILEQNLNGSLSKYDIRSDAGKKKNFIYGKPSIENETIQDHQSYSPLRPAKKYEQNLKLAQELSSWKEKQLRKSSRRLINQYPTRKNSPISRPNQFTSDSKCQANIEKQKLQSLYNTISLFFDHCQKLQRRALKIQNPRLKQLIQSEIQEQTALIEQLNKVASKTRKILVKKLSSTQAQ